VAPAPMQEALLGKDNAQRARRDDAAHNDSHTPLPKPIPFHSDADEFPDEAFEEATKVRALDELIAQTAGGGGQDELAARRGNGRPDAARGDSVSERAETKPMGELPEAPHLPTPPEPFGRPQAKLLDTSPSPRLEPAQPESLAKTRLGVEPARARVSTPPAFAPLGQTLGELQGPPHGQSSFEAPPLSSGMRALPSEQTEPARLPPMQSRSSAPLVILILLLVAGAGAAVWFLVLRPRTTGELRDHASGSSQPGSAATGSGAVASGSTGSGSAAGSNAPVIAVADTVISASVDGARVEIAGTGQSGPAPFTARLEKGKSYKARISAHGYATLEIDMKGGDENRSATLIAKPRVLSIDSDPSGAVILVDSGATGHTTPFDIELTAAQATKKTIRVQLRKSGYRALDRTVDLGKLTEEDTRMLAKLNEHLAVAPPINRPGSTVGSGKGSDATTGSGSDAAPPTNGSAQGSGNGSAAPAGGAGGQGPVTSPSGSPPGAANASGGSGGSAAEPEPEFTKPHQ
jgi:hypothetical protein